MSEHTEQVLLFNWAAGMEALYPDLTCLYAIPNGGLRAKATAVKLKQERQSAGDVKRGVLDVHLPVARGGYIGCWIEMKWGKNKPTDDQLLWIERLRRQGHFCTVCYSHEEAEETLEHYLMGYIVKEQRDGPLVSGLGFGRAAPREGSDADFWASADEQAAKEVERQRREEERGKR